MSTIRNTIKRIFSISFRRFFQCIEVVHRESRKSSIYILFDMFFSYIKYGTGYLDYLTFGFVNLDSSVRKTYMNMNMNLSLVRNLNHKDYRYLLDDKIEFNRLFADLLGREYINISETDEATFRSFLAKHRVVFAKPISLFGGEGIIRLDVDNLEDISLVYSKLLEEKKYDVEQQIVQHQRMNLLSDSSVNSLRITTLLVDDTVYVLYTLVRISDGKSYVDNISSGGMYCPVDENGIITADAFCDARIEYLTTHPQTNTVFKGFRIPCYDEAIDLVKKAALRLPQVRYVGWDVAIAKTGPVLIEGNTIPGYDMPQNYKHLGKYKVGILPKVREILKDEYNI